MQYVLLILSLFLIVKTSNTDCPAKGDSPKDKLQKLDILKNRNITSNNVTKLNLSDIMKPGDDTNRYSDSNYVELSGYVFMVKRGGSETCNCHTKEKEQLDIHIELVEDLKNSDGTKRMIVEINRYTIASNPSMSYDNIHKLIGKKVTVQGWLFFDGEHKQNALNTSPNGTNLWRATCWEIHPVMSIKESL